MLERTKHPSVVCHLGAEEVPELAEDVARAEDEPYGGIPTLAYARLFERARDEGVTVLLDGQGMDEQWAGYDYYLRLGGDEAPPLVQGARSDSTRAECLTPELRSLAAIPPAHAPFGDLLRNTQYRDLFVTKLPRALRFNDRVSMRVGRELREPFLDHRLVELALRQPPERKVGDGKGKRLLRQMVANYLPGRLLEAPKRPVQTPQREWLRGPLRPWAVEMVEAALEWKGGTWLDEGAVRSALGEFLSGEGDNSHFVWQWVSVAQAAQLCRERAGVTAR
jgi:asparagine synthase (glutamine-hydrolysing)